MGEDLSARRSACDRHFVKLPLDDLVASGLFDPAAFITQEAPIVSVINTKSTSAAATRAGRKPCSSWRDRAAR